MRRALAALLVGCVACGREATRMTAPPTFVERIVEPRQQTDGPPPLLVLLHGIGADEHDLVDIAPALDPRLKIVSLRAPRRYSIGYSWFDIRFEANGTVTPNLEQARNAIRDVVAWIAAAPAQHGTDPQRTFLLGFSQGAMMSLGVLHAAPKRLAGVLALSGRFAAEAFVPADGDAMATVPVFVAHGLHDDVLPVTNGRGIRDALSGAVRDVTYREYAVGHGIDAAELRDLAAWLASRL